MMRKFAAKNEKEAIFGQMLKYGMSSIDARLNWLEEANRLTYDVLTEKERQVRAELRKGA